ncbi:transporter substrate-binding domain-containing protein [Lactococcus garvieae]|uniref:transporter substrate-binding domain-containing protein n=1 Tax=Lactococcus garvieae TaxID=1363 RepID=UPI0009C0C17D|nr:transporter substrate-binding domain-containing protein [Lactococcus garvieae]
MNKKLVLVLALFSLTSFGVLTACSKKEDVKSEPKEIIVATNANSKPNTYMENDELTGYDVELARAVFDELPEYKLKFQVIDFNSVLSGIDNGRFQMAANALSWTPERAEKYNYSLPLSKSATSVAVKPNLEVKTLADLAGKTTEVLSGVQVATMLENWNKENPDKAMKLKYMDASYPLPSYVADVDSGKSDFVIYDQISLTQIIQQHDYKLKVTPIDLGETDKHTGFSYFLFGKDSEDKDLQKKVDQALVKLQKNGTMKKLSQKYLGGDFTPREDDMKDGND